MRRREIIQRTRAARRALQLKRTQVAHALDVPLDEYRRYERDLVLPRQIMSRFCEVTHISPCYLLTGEHPPPGIVKRYQCELPIGTHWCVKTCRFLFP